MLKRLNDEEIKQVSLDILIDVASFCEKNGINYFLACGTLLGAVRHNGFIPWDDDIDIIMPRPDYDNFLKSFVSEIDEVKDFNSSNLCIETFAKVSRKGTIMIDRELGRKLWGVNIDIFPLDGAPGKGVEDHYSRMLKLYSWVPRLCPFYKVVGAAKAKWFFKYIIKRLRYPHKGTCQDVKKELLSRLYDNSFDFSPLAGAYFGDDGIREFMPKEWFENYIELDFEGKKYSAISHYDDYLRQLFGDYMELPPENERHSHHRYDSYIEE